MVHRPQSSLIAGLTEAPRHRRRIVGLAAVIGALLSAPLGAQVFGQWWWQGALGLGQVGSDSFTDDTRRSKFAQDDLSLFWELNGYLGHPALGRFKLGLDFTLSEFEGSRSEREDTLGIDLDVRTTQRGAYPAQLFFRRSRFDYALRTDRAAPPFFQLPQDSTAWGASAGLRRGLLRGTRFGARRTSVSFPDAISDGTDSQFLSWSRSLENSRHQFQIRRTEDDYRTREFSAENLTLNFTSSGHSGDTWNWSINGNGFQRDSRFDTGLERLQENYRLRARSFRPVRGTDRVEFRADLDWSRFDQDPWSRGHGLSSSYLWRNGESFEVRPFVAYRQGRIGDGTISSPRAGVSVTARRKREAYQLLTSATVGYGTVERSQARSSREQSNTDFSLSGSLTQGRPGALRKQLEFQVSRNELQVARGGILDDPEFEVPPRILETENAARLRASLSRSFRGFNTSAWAQWNRRESADASLSGRRQAEGLTGSFVVDRKRYGIRGSFGSTELDLAGLGRQEAEYAIGSAFWRPWSFFNLDLVYRADRRNVRLGPDLDGERIDLRFRLRAGLLSIEGRLFENTQQQPGGFERTDRGFRWTLSRRFGGWLPIVTAPQRRGFVR